MPGNKQKKNTHLLSRAGFGPSVNQLITLDDNSHKHTWDNLIKDSTDVVEAFNTVDSDLIDMVNNTNMNPAPAKKELNADEKKMIFEKNRKSITALNLFWINNMINSKAQLREKIALFWHGHFACRSLNAIYQQQLLNSIRINALGNFRDLLFKVSKSAAMLNFLNNNQNRKDHPNENFAREVMELFTLGRGHYSENDIKEAARAFTGWVAKADGSFVFREALHDKGTKKFLGRTGNFNGDDILNILLEQKETAVFITRKLYIFLVNDSPDEDKIRRLAEKFYKDNYQIEVLLKEIFISDWFYNEENIGVKIKSPVELLVGIQRILPMQLENTDFLITVQKILGQLLLYPPNVAGWAGGRTWIDSSTLMVRMRLPKLLNDGDALNLKPKDDDDLMMGMTDKNGTIANKATKRKNNLLGKEIITNIDWNSYLSYFSDTKKEDLTDAISKLLLLTNNTVSQDLIKQYAVIESREQFIKTATIEVMSLPEYQMC